MNVQVCICTTNTAVWRSQFDSRIEFHLRRNKEQSWRLKNWPAAWISKHRKPHLQDVHVEYKELGGKRRKPLSLVHPQWSRSRISFQNWETDLIGSRASRSSDGSPLQVFPSISSHLTINYDYLVHFDQCLVETICVTRVTSMLRHEAFQSWGHLHPSLVTATLEITWSEVASQDGRSLNPKILCRGEPNE